MKAAHVIEVAELKEARASRIAGRKRRKSKVAAVRQMLRASKAAAEVTRLKGRNFFLAGVPPMFSSRLLLSKCLPTSGLLERRPDLSS